MSNGDLEPGQWYRVDPTGKHYGDRALYVGTDIYGKHVFHCTSRDGSQAGYCRDVTVAGPYVPPKPKRGEVWITRDTSGYVDYHHAKPSVENDPRLTLAYYREVLPDDPDPDKAIEVREELQQWLAECRISVDHEITVSEGVIVALLKRLKPDTN